MQLKLESKLRKHKNCTASFWYGVLRRERERERENNNNERTKKIGWKWKIEFKLVYRINWENDENGFERNYNKYKQASYDSIPLINYRHSLLFLLLCFPPSVFYRCVCGLHFKIRWTFYFISFFFSTLLFFLQLCLYLSVYSSRINVLSQFKILSLHPFMFVLLQFPSVR